MGIAVRTGGLMTFRSERTVMQGSIVEPEQELFSLAELVLELDPYPT
jgi:hypothetical protein